MFFSAARALLVDLDRVIHDPPDLCVEVISPSTEDRDRGRKMQMFARFGVPEYWIVDPRLRRIEVYRLEREAYALLADVSGEGIIESPTLRGLTSSLWPSAGLVPRYFRVRACQSVRVSRPSTRIRFTLRTVARGTMMTTKATTAQSGTETGPSPRSTALELLRR